MAAQYILLFGLILLFSSLLVVIHQSIILNFEAMMDAQGIIDALSLAQRYIDEAMSKSYDEAIVNENLIASPSNFSAIGIDKNERKNGPTSYDDIDDFNNFSSHDEWGSDSYDVNISVYYINASFDSTASRSNQKEFVVRVTKENTTVDVTMRHIFSYLGEE